MINSLGAIEERESYDIEEEIINFGFDLVSFKVDTGKSERGFLPLEYAGKVMKGILNIIKFGACSELNPKNKYKQPYKEAKELIKNCELAQTKPGSFIINIRVPLDETYLKKEHDEKKEYIADLGRRAIKRIIRGFLEVKKLDVSDEEKFNIEYDETLNKNICDSMSEILEEDSDLKLNISAKWNPAKKIEEKILSSVELDSKSVLKKFKKMSIYLKHMPEDKIMIISGEIREMKRQYKEEMKEKRLIKIYDKELKRNIYSWLEDENYKKACDAHRDKKIVKLKGILSQKENGRWFLDKPELLEK